MAINGPELPFRVTLTGTKKFLWNAEAIQAKLNGFNGAGRKLAGEFSHLGRALTGLGNAGLTAAKYLATVAAVTAAIGSVITIKALKSFASFQRGLQEIASIAGNITQKALESLGDTLIDLGAQFGQGMAEAAKAAYDLASAGFSASESITVLRHTAIAAVAGLTDIGTATNAAISVMRAYGLTSAETGRILDMIFASVQKGRFTFEEYAKAIGQVLPSAKAAGVALEELNAMLSTVTLAGINLEEATTAVNRLLTQLVAPTDIIRERLDALGIVVTDTAGRWVGAMNVFRQMQGLTFEQIRGITGEVRAARALVPLLNMGDTFEEHLKANIDSVGKSFEAFMKNADTTSFGWQQMTGEITKAWTTLGELLEPLGKMFLGIFIDIFKSINNGISRNKGVISDIVQNIVPKLDKYLREIFSTLGEIFKAWVNQDFGSTLEHIGGVLDHVLKIGAMIVKNILTAGKFLTDVLQPASYMLDIVGAIGKFISSAMLKIWDVLGLLGYIIPGVGRFADLSKEIFENTWNLSNQLDELGNDVRGLLGDVRSGIDDSAVALEKFVTGGVRGMKQLSAAAIDVRKKIYAAAKPHLTGGGYTPPTDLPMPTYTDPYSTDASKKFRDAFRKRYQELGVDEGKITEMLAKEMQKRSRAREYYNAHFQELVDEETAHSEEMYQRQTGDIEQQLQRIQGIRKDLQVTATFAYAQSRKEFEAGNKEAAEAAMKLYEETRDEIKNTYESEEKLNKKLHDMNVTRQETAARREIAIKNRVSNKLVDIAEKAAAEAQKIEDRRLKEAERAAEQAAKKNERWLEDDIKNTVSAFRKVEGLYKDSLKEQERDLEKHVDKLNDLSDDRFKYEADLRERLLKLDAKYQNKSERMAAQYTEARRLARTSRGLEGERQRERLGTAQDMLLNMLESGKLNNKQRRIVMQRLKEIHERIEQSYNREASAAASAGHRIIATIYNVKDKLEELYKLAGTKVLDIKSNIPAMLDMTKQWVKYMKIAHAMTSAKGNLSRIFHTMHSGGWVTSDKAIANLQPGEFVVSREAALRNAALLESLNRGGTTNNTTTTAMFNLPNVRSFGRDFVRNVVIPELSRANRRGLTGGNRH